MPVDLTADSAVLIEYPLVILDLLSVYQCQQQLVGDLYGLLDDQDIVVVLWLCHNRVSLRAQDGSMSRRGFEVADVDQLLRVGQVL